MSAIIPASIRNSNPLAMWPGPSAKKFGATSAETLTWRDKKGKVHEDQCATFPTAVHGAAAAFDLMLNGKLNGKYLYRGKTVEKAIATWCGGNDVGDYLKMMDQYGVDRLAVIEEDLLKDTAKALNLVKAMAHHETGKPFPMSESEWVKAHDLAFGDHVLPKARATNDVPTVNPEARAEAAKKEVQALAVKVGGATAGGAAGTTLTHSPPDISVLTDWQRMGTTLADIGSWALSNWKLTLTVGAIYWAVVHGLPMLHKARQS